MTFRAIATRAVLLAALVGTAVAPAAPALAAESQARATAAATVTTIPVVDFRGFVRGSITATSTVVTICDRPGDSVIAMGEVLRSDRRRVGLYAPPNGCATVTAVAGTTFVAVRGTIGGFENDWHMIQP